MPWSHTRRSCCLLPRIDSALFRSRPAGLLPPELLNFRPHLPFDLSPGIIRWIRGINNTARTYTTCPRVSKTRVTRPRRPANNNDKTAKEETPSETQIISTTNPTIPTAPPLPSNPPQPRQHMTVQAFPPPQRRGSEQGKEREEEGTKQQDSQGGGARGPLPDERRHTRTLPEEVQTALPIDMM